MKRIFLSAAILLGVGAFFVLAGGASNPPSATGTYKIELDNAFGLVTGADFKVAGVRAGTIKSLGLCYTSPHAGCQNPLHALVTVQVTQAGFGQFRSDAFCQSRPQSLIGEYFVDCQPGQYGSAMKPGSTIPVTHTQSTIPADLLTNVMRMPYRQRFSLIINELGAGVAGRSGDLQAALQRAVPALTETDNLLNLLANDSTTLQNLTRDSDSVITALANNSAQVQRFIVEANNTATATATQQTALKATFQQLPGFLEQLRPTLAQLGAATDANLPVLVNLNAAAGTVNRLFTDIPPFSHSALPALKSLGQASVTGKSAVQAATPTIADLNRFAAPTPELAQNLSIVLQALDNRGRAVERDPRSPGGGQGYTGLEALLQYVFNQTMAIDTFGPFGHMLAVDAFVDFRCTPYATPGTIATNLKTFGTTNYRQCYSWLGPSQIGVNQPDPSNPGACVPDPGGAPPGHAGPVTTACKLAASDTAVRAAVAKASTGSASSSATGATPSGSAAASPAAPSGSPPSGAASSGGGGGSTGTGGGGGPSTGSGSSGLSSLGQTLGQLLGTLGLGGRSASAASGGSGSGTSGASAGNQAQQLLSYLLAP
jgi:ABC-type transporter Mla subunit MlaD